MGVLVAPLFDGSDSSVDGVIPRATNLALLGGRGADGPRPLVFVDPYFYQVLDPSVLHR